MKYVWSNLGVTLVIAGLFVAKGYEIHFGSLLVVIGGGLIWYAIHLDALDAIKGKR